MGNTTKNGIFPRESFYSWEKTAEKYQKKHGLMQSHASKVCHMTSNVFQALRCEQLALSLELRAISMALLMAFQRREWHKDCRKITSILRLRTYLMM